MLSSNTWRTLCSRRALLSPNRMLMNRKAGQATVRFSVNTKSLNDVSFAKQDSWRNNTIRKALGNEKKRIFSAHVVFLRNYSTSHIKLNCWKCKQPLENDPAFFCLACKVVQPPEEGTSYFKIMDCDYSFSLDTLKLQRRYVQLQRSLHPDNFSQKSVEEQKYSEIQSALVNKAYKTLLKPLSRGLYMLELQGMRIEEGTDSEADSQFLMELMEINEFLNEAQTAGEAEQIGGDVKGKLTDLTKRIDAALLKGDLAAAKALLAQMKYYANIEEKVKQKLSEFM
ncbi:iron-sulfur cluster co-chaperone protein HscB [Takifugu rubripes]|uniref:Iron-sulfur cluster co-chaperone protein HscB n=1 Tax=Takifugu rubripes TaxID=31033 RepID=H2UZ00_TAKRU|nr:iron-sulfur cluster co-chaperone protein HscB [Takifugu rubripes]